MKDTYRAWKMCRVLRQKEHVLRMDATSIEHPELKGLEIAWKEKSRDEYGYTEEGLRLLYIHAWYPKIDLHIETEPERSKSEKRLKEAQAAIECCIKKGYLTRDKNTPTLIYFDTGGWTFATVNSLINAAMKEWGWAVMVFLTIFGWFHQQILQFLVKYL